MIKMIKLDGKINNSVTERIQKCQSVIILVKQLINSSGHWRKLKFRERTRDFLLWGLRGTAANDPLHIVRACWNPAFPPLWARGWPRPQSPCSWASPLSLCSQCLKIMSLKMMANCPPLLCVDLIWGQLLAHGPAAAEHWGKSSQNHDYF